jgi:hypothetical protein
MRPAVEEYLTAEKLFLEAARAPQIAAVTSAATTIPAVVQPATVAPTVAPSITSTTASSTPTTIPAASNAPAIDQATAVRVLNEYGQVARALDLTVLQHSYPLLSFGATAKLRIEALKKDYNYCDYTFSNVKIAFSTATDASIGADVVEAVQATDRRARQAAERRHAVHAAEDRQWRMDGRERGRTELRRLSAFREIQGLNGMAARRRAA